MDRASVSITTAIDEPIIEQSLTISFSNFLSLLFALTWNVLINQHVESRNFLLFPLRHMLFHEINAPFQRLP